MKTKCSCIIFSTVMLLCCQYTIHGQINPPIYNQNNTQIDTSSNEGDSIIQKNGFFSLFKGKPGRAALYSLIIPGGGQVYNKKWWKVPLALGVDGGLTYVLISNRNSYKTSQAAYIEALAQDPVPPQVNTLKEQRNFYRKWSEYAWIWLIAGHLFTVVDAYVDRHLIDFDVSQDISSNLMPSYQMVTPLNIGLKININKKSVSVPNQEILSNGIDK
ncbi:MAG: DUF5683 domain-containing protein [Saprospiraceae bacterium]